MVYALVEHANGGIFRSDDKGETWEKMSDTNPRPMYYSKVHIDPNNDQRLWVLGAQMFTSEDGGKTFNSNLVQRIHGDYHAMWINPANSDHMIVGSDGGIHWSGIAAARGSSSTTSPSGSSTRSGWTCASPITSAAACRTTTRGAGRRAR